MIDLTQDRKTLLAYVMSLPEAGPEFDPYRRARRAYNQRFKAALTACIDAGMDTARLAGKGASDLEALLQGAARRQLPLW